MRLALALCLVPLAAQADNNMAADSALFTQIQAGIVCADPPDDHQPAPDTISGFVDIVGGAVYLGRPALRIPAVPGLAFGVIGQVSPMQGAQDVTISVTHPPMAPGGVTRESWLSDFLPDAQTANFFRFDLPEERVPGPWQMEATLDGQVLYQASFEVVDPALMPNFIDPCAEPGPIS